MTPKASSYQQISAGAEREERILSHLPLVKHVLGKLAHRLPGRVDLDLLESAGIAGLIEAADRYDPSCLVKFSTFAFNRIRGAIVDELRRLSPYPQEVQDRIKRLQGAMRNQPQAGLEEWAQEAELTVEQAWECQRLLETGTPQTFEEDSVKLHQVFEQNEYLSGLDRAERARHVAEAIAQLTEQQRLVLIMHYYEDLRQKEIAAVMGLSPTRISRLLEQAHEALRNWLRSYSGQ